MNLPKRLASGDFLNDCFILYKRIDFVLSFFLCAEIKLSLTHTFFGVKEVGIKNIKSSTTFNSMHKQNFLSSHFFYKKEVARNCKGGGANEFQPKDELSD